VLLLQFLRQHNTADLLFWWFNTTTKKKVNQGSNSKQSPSHNQGRRLHNSKNDLHNLV
jgi:hypothetical protein